MKTTEFKANADKGNYKGNDVIYMYKSYSYRWGEGMADPNTNDEQLHLSVIAAKKAADSIALEIGYTAKVDRLAIYADEFNECFSDIKEIIYLNDIITNVDVINCEEIYSSVENTGKSLDPESIIVTYRHHRYINYAYQIVSVDFVKYTNLRTEADLIQDADSVMAHYYAHFENINDMEDSFARKKIVPFNKLNRGSALIGRFLEENGKPNYI